jgi:hypothetical protein
MGWVTIYITGREDFREDLREKLDDSDLKVMSGYTGGSDGVDNFSDLYWVDEKIKLREFKEAIGSKLIWKYRLKFFTSLEAFIESQNAKRNESFETTDEERALFEKIASSVYREAS